MHSTMRKIIYKIKPLHDLCRYIVVKNNEHHYASNFYNSEMKDNIKKLQASKVGKRCFIVGNGPSLTPKDLDKIATEDSFGMNFIFKMFDKTSWRPSFYITQDVYGVSKQDIERLANISDLFLGVYYFRKNKMKNIDCYCYYHDYMNGALPQFSDDISKVVYDSSTVTYSAMQIAAYMGYSEIYLIGVDNNFKYIIESSGEIRRGNIENNHFYDDSESNEAIYNELKILKGYIRARDYANENGFKIYNATRGGKLDVFERVDLDDIL